MKSHSNLALRVVAAAVLMPLALGAAYYGGWPHALFWTAAAIVVLFEWTELVCGRRGRISFAIGAGALLAAMWLAAGAGRVDAAIMIVVLGAAAASALAPSAARVWIGAGTVYAAALMMSAVVLRADALWGFAAIVLVFAVVWATDIAGYFVGRAIGGPKLMPRVSPGKTWAGAIGGTAAALLAAIAFAIAIGSHAVAAIGLVGILLSVAAQAGDLLESWIKRQFGAKDSGAIIPGHGGVMDRVDGFCTAVTLAAVIGACRAGADAAATGVVLW